MKNDKKLFIDAYCWLFDVTKKEAEKIYRSSKPEFNAIVTPQYIKIVITSYTENFIKGFYSD